jgi:hypothetical protein
MTKDTPSTKRPQPDPDLVAQVITRLLAGEWSKPGTPRANMDSVKEGRHGVNGTRHGQTP